MKDPIAILIDGTKYPAAIEARLPEGVPKISTILLDATGKIPDLPDFPVEIPDLPVVPVFPELPELPGMPGELRRRIISGVEVRRESAA